MNDYFLKSMIRQRQEQILDAVTMARLSRLDRPRLNCRRRKIIRVLHSFFRRWARHKVLRQPVLEEGKYV
jgi:hypothetical protein